ncbi:MAG: P1 family peptidase [Candidatus Schekmanbacteria bacterium]|nr:P1 family peptidase [Candidatus Schekmanbacteria bacterium]
MHGVSIGHYSDFKGITGCTVFLFKDGASCSASITGGAAGTKEFSPLSPSHIVEKINAICIAGGSAYGLDASSGVMRYLEEKKKGFPAGKSLVPIVPSAILFDLHVGDQSARPDAEAGYIACRNANEGEAQTGSIGAGTGATVGKLFGISRAMKGGVGFSRKKICGDVNVETYVFVNAFGDVLASDRRAILAGCLDKNKKGFVRTSDIMLKKDIGTGFTSNTTIAVILTDAHLNKVECRIVSSLAHNGMARAIDPVGTVYDGDVIFTASVGEKKVDVNVAGIAAAEVLEDAIRDAVIKSKSLGGVSAACDIEWNKTNLNL